MGRNRGVCGVTEGSVRLRMSVSRGLDDGFCGGQNRSRMLRVSPEAFTRWSSRWRAEDQEPHSSATYTDSVRTRIRVVSYPERRVTGPAMTRHELGMCDLSRVPRL